MRRRHPPPKKNTKEVPLDFLATQLSCNLDLCNHFRNACEISRRCQKCATLWPSFSLPMHASPKAHIQKPLKKREFSAEGSRWGQWVSYHLVDGELVILLLRQCGRPFGDFLKFKQSSQYKTSLMFFYVVRSSLKCTVRMSFAKDYYSILGVPKTAARSEIKSAFKKLAMNYHPDVSKDPGAHVGSLSFTRIQPSLDRKSVV